MANTTSGVTGAADGTDGPPGAPRLIVLGLWAVFLAILGGFMLLWTIIGLVSVLLGALSLFFDLGSNLNMQLGGEPVQTTRQKLLFTGLGLVLAVIGSLYWKLRLRGYVAGPLICFAMLMAFLIAIAWTNEGGDILSVGGAN